MTQNNSDQNLALLAVRDLAVGGQINFANASTIASQLPPGYSLRLGGVLEGSAGRFGGEISVGTIYGQDGSRITVTVY